MSYQTPFAFAVALSAAMALNCAGEASPRRKTPAPKVRADEASACAAAIRSKSATIDPECWRVGSLALGMGTADVARILGAPDFQGEGGAQSTQAIYVFPRNLAAMLAAEPSASPAYRLLSLKFFNGQLAEISNDISQTIRGTPCRSPSRSPGKSYPAPGFSRFQSFAGVKVGDGLETVIKSFGPPTTKTSGNFLSYWPTPLTFEALDGRKVSGFSIATNQSFMGVGPAASVFLVKDPSSCRVTGLKFLANEASP